MTEEELDAKLKAFAGAMGELDSQTQEKVGKLLVKEEDEDIDANDETWNKILQIKGGYFSMIFICGMVLCRKFVDYYNERLNQEFALVDPIEDGEAYTSFVIKLFLVSLGLIAFANVKDTMMRRRNKKIGQTVR